MKSFISIPSEDDFLAMLDQDDRLRAQVRSEIRARASVSLKAPLPAPAKPETAQ